MEKRGSLGHLQNDRSIELQSAQAGVPPDSKIANCAQNHIREAKAVPTLGFAALAGSAFTVFISLAMLLAINGKPVWPNTGVYKVVQPASALSVLLSLNSILISAALYQGVTIAWWFQASKKDATVAKLHQTWASGTSALEALRLWRHFSYVTLAAWMVALMPVNSFLLQGAITTPVSQINNTSTLPMPMAKHLPLGYSASGAPSSDGSVGLYSVPWTRTWQQMQFDAWTPYARFAYIGSRSDLTRQPYDLGYNKSAPYSARVPGAGFTMHCNASTVPFDLVPTEERPATYGRIFSTSVSWVPAHPNTIHLDLLWKAVTSCKGEYEVRNCTLQAAIVEYPVTIQMNISGSPYTGPFFSLAEGSTRANDRLVETLPVLPSENLENSTFGGIAGSLSDTFGSYYDVYDSVDGQNSNDSYYYYVGQLPDIVGAETDSQGYNPYNCNSTFEYGLELLAFYQNLGKGPVDSSEDLGWSRVNETGQLEEIIFDRLRQAMFLASVYEGSQVLTNDFTDYEDGDVPYDRAFYMQDIVATQFHQIAKYKVRLYLWALSLIITWAAVGFVIPLFYGYWTLSRQTSLSPVDMARVFNAPVLNQIEDHKSAEQLLREIGTKNVHSDLWSTPGETEAGRIEHHGRTVLVEEVRGDV